MNDDTLARFEAFFDEHAAAVVNYCGSWHVRDPESVTQEIFLAAFKNFQSYRGEASRKTWLFAIARNVLSRYHRKQARRSELLDANLDHIEAWAMGGGTESPYDVIDGGETVRLLNEAVDALGPPDAELLRLRYYGNLTFEEIAQLHSMSADAVRKRIQRAKPRLRQLLATAGYLDPEDAS